MPKDDHASSGENSFIKARDDFIALLSESEKANFAKCSSVDELLQAIESLQHLGTRRSLVTRCLKKIKTFGDTLTPYFGIMEIFCGSNPEFANLALGGLLLVLKLASHFVTFFEKLSDVLSKIAARLPRYQELYDALSKDPGICSPSLTESLQKVYCHLFEFYGAVARIFSKKCGRIKRTPAILADLAWHPFDARFEQIIEKITFHQRIVKEELGYAKMGSLASTVRAVDQQRRMETAARLDLIEDAFNKQLQLKLNDAAMRWLDPPDIKTSLEHALDQKAEGTTEWLLEDSKFLSWRNYDRPEHHTGVETGTASQFLWISGKPGSGKTILSASTAEELGKCYTTNADYPPEVCYYIFNQTAGNSNSLAHVFRSIAAQIFHHFHKLERIRNIFVLASTGVQFQKAASENEVIETITQCLPHLPNLHFVIDGLDECKDVSKLVAWLLKWCETTPLKVMVASRPDVASLRRLAPKESRIEITASVLEQDIRCYLASQVDQLFREDLFPAHADQDHVVQCLLDHAEGMFLWVRLMVTFLSVPSMTKAQRLDSAVRPPSEGLDRLEDMYCRISQRLLSQDTHSKNLAQNTLTWAAHSSLQSPELREAICPEGWDMDDGSATTRFDHAVVLSCCGLIEKGPHGTYQYIHLTALDFVQRSSLIPPPPEAKAIMAGRCISYLAFSLPQKPLSGDIYKSADRTEVRRKWPLLQVSAAKWAALAIDALMMDDTTARNSEVVEEMITLGLRYLKMGLGLMVWIESLYTLGVATSLLGYQSSRQRYSLVGKFSGSSQSTIFLQGLEGLMEDVKVMHREWGPSLEESPAEIWRDVTAFTTSKFLVKTKAVHVETLASNLRIPGTQDPELSVKPTFSTSMTSPDGSLLANLGIFPSKYFRMGWNEHGDIPCYTYDGTISRPAGQAFSRVARCPQTLQEVQDTCVGWIARYEVFSIAGEASERMICTLHDLDAADIEICLRQGLWFSPVGGWKCRFPLTIDPGLHGFTLLNKVFLARKDGQRHRPTSLRIDFNETRRTIWGPCHTFSAGYSYEIFWSPDSKYLGFSDVTTAGDICLAVFDTSEGFASGRAPSLVKYASIKPCSNIMLACCQFHPTMPLLLFLEGPDIMLWRFQDADHPERFHSAGMPTMEVHLVRSDSRVEFSHCGTSIAVYHTGRQLPTLFCLPPISEDRMMTTTTTVSQKRSAECDEYANRSNKRLRVSSKSGTTDLAVRTLSVLKQIPSNMSTSTTAILRTDGHSSGQLGVALLQRRENPEKISLVYGTDGDCQSTPLLSLPTYIPAHATSSTLSISDANKETGTGRCTLVVNSASRILHSSEERGAAEHLPLVVRKDVRALRAEDRRDRLGYHSGNGSDMGGNRSTMLVGEIGVSSHSPRHSTSLIAPSSSQYPPLSIHNLVSYEEGNEPR